jgi:tetratricopeptide (TPR) repeat protein
MTETIETKLTQAAQARRENLPADALALYEQARVEAQAASHTLQLARALSGLGQIHRDLGDNVTALDHYIEALKLLRPADEPIRRADTLRHAGDIASELGHHAQARTHITEALDIYRNHKEVAPLELANTLRVLALNEERHLRIIWHEAGTLYATAGITAGLNESKAHIQHLSA